MAKRKDPANRNISPIRLRSGTWAYQVRVMVRGRKRSKLCPTLEAAQAVRDDWERGGLPAEGAEEETPEAEPAVEDALDRHEVALVANGQNPAPPQYVRAALRRHYPELLGIAVDAITPDHFTVFQRRRLAAGIKPNTVIGNLRGLRAAIKRLRPDFVVSEKGFPKEDKTRHKQLAPREKAQGLLACREPAQTMAELAALTFMRMGELRLLERPQVDFVAGTITLHRAKKGPRVVGLGTYALTILRRQMARHGHALVFARPDGRPYSRGYIWLLWKTAMRRIGRPDFHFHDLRHHAAMTALANGATFPELQALGGWEDPEMVNRYATASSGRLRALQDLGHQAAGGRRRHE
jgi:integrase